jgi:hypothetical protein
MERYSIKSRHLAERPWWSGYPVPRRRGWLRRVVMTGLLLALVLFIGAYWFLTDSQNVIRLAQFTLSGILRGRVEIGSAHLSIFEGLRINDVRVYVDPKGDAPDSLMFSAQKFVVNYDPRKLVRGQFDAAEIIAEQPHVYLTLRPGPRGDQWNFQRLSQKNTTAPSGPPAPPTKKSLPAILLRDAIIEISQVEDNRRKSIGQMNIDGHVTPTGDGETYRFEMQSRGLSKELGPYVFGSVSVNTGALDAHLQNVQFGGDLRAMFPEAIRQWWQQHELSGEIDRVDASYTPPHRENDVVWPARFSVRTGVKGMTLAVSRQEWSSKEDVTRWQRTQDALDLLQTPWQLAGFASGPHAEALTPAQAAFHLLDSSPLRLNEVTGSFRFTQDLIEIENLLVRVNAGDADRPEMSNKFLIDGRLDGYRPDAPLHLRVRTADQDGIYFPAHPTFIQSLPTDARNFYNDLKPEGKCRIDARIDRPIEGERPRVNARVEIVDAQFVFRQFPYPFSHAHGAITFGHEHPGEKDMVHVLGITGTGMAGGLNEHCTISVHGTVGPVGPENQEPGFDLIAEGTEVHAEPALLAASPPEVRKVLRIFDAPGKGEFPKFRGNFVTHVLRQPGPGQRMTFNTEVDIVDAAGAIVGFPYPCPKTSGKVSVLDGYALVHDVHIYNGLASSTVNGRVTWADGKGVEVPLGVDLKISVADMPLDEELLRAIPPGQSIWLRKLGVAGILNCDGRVFTTIPADWKSRLRPGERMYDPPIEFDLNIGLHDGTIWPADGLFSVSSATGKLHLTNDRLDIIDLQGRRQDGHLATQGSIVFAGGSPRIRLKTQATNLTLDRPLYSMLPVEGRKSWDEVRPSGTVDADIDFDGEIGGDKPALVASAAPLVDPPEIGPHFTTVLRPRDLTVNVRTVPFSLNFTGGTVTISHGNAELNNLTGTHGNAKFVVSGEGSMGAGSAWKLALKADNLRADDQLEQAIPPLLRHIVDNLKLQGTLALDFPALSYGAPATADGDPDIDVAGVVSLADGALDAGVALTGVRGGIDFSTSVRQGKLKFLKGTAKFDALTFAGHKITDLRFDLLRQVDQTDLHIDKVSGKVAQGELGGSAILTFPDHGSNRYTMNLAVRNADVRELTGEEDPKTRGALTASLSMEGNWDDASARRGRGDVVVAGKQLYRIPLMLGLLQVTNLSLPIGQPFTKGKAHFSVEGTRVTFEQMDLSADNLTMTGTGSLDFATKQVRLSLATENPSAFKIPFVTDLWNGARQQLLHIDVRGTVQEPKVSPTSLAIVTTTIDQVFKGEPTIKKPATTTAP